MTRNTRRLLAVAVFTGAAVATASPALAHPHRIAPAHGGAGQVVANGQNHAPFSSGTSCGGDPAAYGLETAHHGPDAGVPGRGEDSDGGRGGGLDGCYQLDGTSPAGDVWHPPFAP